MRNHSVVLERLGTVDRGIVEANPVVFRDRLYRFEYIRTAYPGNDSGTSYFRFVDVKRGDVLPPFGGGLHMGNAFVWKEKLYVSCVEQWGGDCFLLLESDDLIHWSAPRRIPGAPGRQCFNTSVCRAGERFVIAFELGAPLAEDDEPFTMFFAESDDLAHWRQLDGASFGRGVYCGAPMLRFFDGFYYFFHLSGNYGTGFRTMVSRSADLVSWSREQLVLDFREDDRRWAKADPSPEELRATAEAKNINASDLDFCEFGGGLYATYSWGDQAGTEFLAVARAACTEREFCLSFFRDGDE